MILAYLCILGALVLTFVLGYYVGYRVATRAVVAAVLPAIREVGALTFNRPQAE